MKRYWFSFELRSSLVEFCYHGPWWISGYGFGADGDEQPCVCMALVAESEDAAQAFVLSLFDAPPDIAEWRFCSERPDDWDPFCDRFERGDWMVWPITPEQATELRRSA